MPRNDKEKWQMDLEEYIRQGEPDQSEKSTVWKTAIGLQDVDGLKNSSYFLSQADKYINGELSLDELDKIINSYKEFLQNVNDIHNINKKHEPNKENKYHHNCNNNSHNSIPNNDENIQMVSKTT